MASAPRFAPRLGLVITDERQIGRGRASDGVTLVVLRTSLLSMPRSAGARRSAERIAAAHPEATPGLFAWHYVTHAADDVLPGRGTRTVDLEDRPCGHLRDEPGVTQAWTVTSTTLEAMGGRHVVLRTPPSFSPSTLSRRRLEAFVARVRSADGPLQLAWEAEGMWSPEETLELGGALDLAVVMPALSSAGRAADLPLDGDRVWRRVGGMGARPELSPAAAEVLAFELADAWAASIESDPAKREAAQPTLLFEGELGHANLRRFLRALELV